MTDDLFELIKRLSPTEKRYVSVELQNQKKEAEENLLLNLFNIINSFEEYDEAVVKKQLRKKSAKSDKLDKFINRFAIEKNNLYLTILKAMRNFNSKKSDYIKLKDYIIFAKHLLDKGLYSQSNKMLRKAKKLATEYSNQLALIEINWAERTLVWKLTEKNINTEIEKLYEEKKVALENLESELIHQDFYDQICLEMVKHMKLTKKQAEELDENFHDFIFGNKVEERTAFAHLRHIQMKGFYYLLKDEQDNIFNTLTEEYEWWEQYSQFKKEDFFRYKITLHNYLLANYRRQNFELVLNIIQTLENKKPKSSLEEVMLFDFTCIFKLLIFINSYQFKEAKALVPFIKKGLRNYVLSPVTRHTIFFNLGTLFFLSEDFHGSCEWLEQLIQGHNTGTREDIRYFGSLLLAICLYELGEISRLDNLFRSIKRSKSGNKKIGPKDLENFAFNHLKKIAAVPSSEKKAAITDFRDELKQIRTLAKSEDQERSFPFLEEFYIWTESKLKKEKMIEIFKKGNGKDIG